VAESIFLRVRRICSARIEDTVDRMETEGGDAVMREAIREVDRAIDEIRAQQQGAMGRRLQAAKQQAMVEAKIAELGSKASFAVDNGRDDLAEAALTRQVDFEAELEKLKKTQGSTSEEEAKLEHSLASLRSRKVQMEDALRAFSEAEVETSMGGDKGFHVQQRIERKVEQAEAAFDRAMGGAGGVSFTRADADTINKVSELDELAKGSSVAGRLAALKANKAA
jgi:phage shock protein A